MGNVEVWLGDLLKEQMKSLHGVIRDAFRTITAPEFELLGFLNSFQAQVRIHNSVSPLHAYMHLLLNVI